MVKLHLQAFGRTLNMEKCKIWFLFTRPFKIFFSKTTKQNAEVLHTNSPWGCLIKVCSNVGSTYIISEIIAKNNLNIINLMQNFENLLLQNY